MGRSYTAGQKAIMAGPVVPHCELIELETPQGTTMRWAVADWTVVVGGETYEGRGDAIGVKFPPEDMSLAAHPLMVQISSVNAAMTSFALSTPMANQRLRIKHAIFDPNTYVVQTPVALAWSGRVSHIDLTNLANQEGGNG